MNPVEQFKTGRTEFFTGSQHSLTPTESEIQLETIIRTAVWRSKSEIRCPREPDIALLLAISTLAFPGLQLIANLFFLKSHDADVVLSSFICGGLLMCFLVCAVVVNAVRYQEWIKSNEPVIVPGRYRVTLVLSRNGLIYAVDRGSVNFEDGYFLFEGLNTTFSFSNSQGIPSRSLNWFQSASRRVRFGSTWPRLNFSVDGVDYELGLHGQESLKRAYDRWRQGPLITTESEVLPPVTPNRAALSSVKGDLNSIWSRAFFSVVLLILGVSAQWHRGYGRRLGDVLFDPNTFSVWTFGICLLVSATTLVFGVWLPFRHAHRRIEYI